MLHGRMKTELGDREEVYKVTILFACWYESYFFSSHKFKPFKETDYDGVCLLFLQKEELQPKELENENAGK